ncbi:hypothetical protein ABFA07_018634 [Porites harrisoni]
MADEKDCEGASSLENSRSRVGGVDSRYLATLQPQDRKRFQEKLKYVVDGELLEIQNPYESWNAPSWSDKPTAWPEIEFGNLWTYLVEKPGPFTEAKMKLTKVWKPMNTLCLAKLALFTAVKLRKRRESSS